MGQIVKKTLLGKELVFSESMDAFNSLRKKYLILSAEARERAENAYKANINSYSSYMKNCRLLMGEIFEHYLQIGVLDIIKFGIFDIDEVVLQQELEQEYGLAYSNAISEFKGRMNQIDAEQSAADTERKETIQDARLVDGTFVAARGDIISDTANVIGSKISAGIMNGLAKGGTALVTAGVRTIERKAAENEKNEIFSNGNTKNGVLDGIQNDVYMLHRTIARLINERTSSEHYYYTKEEDIVRFEPVCRNILRGNFKSDNDTELEIQQIHNVLMMNPYELRMYAYIMQDNNGITEELKSLMDYLYVDKPSLASSYLETKYDLNDYKTYEEMVEFEKVVIAELALFSIAGCAFSEQVTVKKERLYIERRTFHQHTYDTIEERDFAEKQYNDFVGDGFAELDIDSLLERDDATYKQDLLEPNRDYIRRELLDYIEAVVDKFKDSDSLSIYVIYAKNKQKERQLVNYEVLNVIEKKYKQLAMKEKIEAKVADIKGKLLAFFKNWKSSMKRFWQKITVKLPFGKNASIGKKKAGIKKKKEAKNDKPQIEAAAVNVETVVTPEVIATPAVQTVPDVIEAPVTQAKQETVAVTETVVTPEIQAVAEAVATSETPSTETATVTADEPVKPAVETKSCPQCGNQLKAAAKFCSKCGYRF